jgi:hypothetical protein
VWQMHLKQSGGSENLCECRWHTAGRFPLLACRMDTRQQAESSGHNIVCHEMTH